MRASITALLVMLLVVTATAAEPTRIPLTNQVARYEREQPVFQSTQISKERGDALLALLDGGRATDRRRTNGFPPGFDCVLPVPPHLWMTVWMTVTLTNGTTYSMTISRDGRLLHLPDGLYDVTDAASKQVAKLMAELEADLRREIVSAPLPCVYKIGTVEDGYSLSGVALLFYGDASKWPLIYEANRKVLKSPNQITGLERLTIPKL